MLHFLRNIFILCKSRFQRSEIIFMFTIVVVVKKWKNKVQHLKKTIIEKGNKKLKRRIYNNCFISFAKNLEIDLCNAVFAELLHLTGSSKSAR